MKITAFVLLFILSGFTSKTQQIDFKVKTESPFVFNVKSLDDNKLQVSLTSNSKDSILYRSFTLNLKDYDDTKLNNFFKIDYDSKNKVTILNEQINPAFNWIKIQNLERKIELKNGIFPKISDVLSLNTNSNSSLVVIQFELNLNKYKNEQIIQKPLNFDQSKFDVKSLKNNSQETFLISF